MPRTPALVVAIVLSALVLFGVGFYSAVTLVGSWWRSGVRMMAIGLGAGRRPFSDRSSVPDGGRVSRAAQQGRYRQALRATVHSAIWVSIDVPTT